MLDILAAKQLVESASMGIAWVPTFSQFADSLTKDMSDELFGKFRQREGRKARMKESVKPTY